MEDAALAGREEDEGTGVLHFLRTQPGGLLLSPHCCKFDVEEEDEVLFFATPPFVSTAVASRSGPSPASPHPRAISVRRTLYLNNKKSTSPYGPPRTSISRKHC